MSKTSVKRKNRWLEFTSRFCLAYSFQTPLRAISLCFRRVSPTKQGAEGGTDDGVVFVGFCSRRTPIKRGRNAPSTPYRQTGRQDKGSRGTKTGANLIKNAVRKPLENKGQAAPVACRGVWPLFCNGFRGVILSEFRHRKPFKNKG